MLEWAPCPCLRTVSRLSPLAETRQPPARCPRTSLASSLFMVRSRCFFPSSCFTLPANPGSNASSSTPHLCQPHLRSENGRRGRCPQSRLRGSTLLCSHARLCLVFRTSCLPLRWMHQAHLTFQSAFFTSLAIAYVEVVYRGTRYLYFAKRLKRCAFLSVSSHSVLVTENLLVHHQTTLSPRTAS